MEFVMKLLEGLEEQKVQVVMLKAWETGTALSHAQLLEESGKPLEPAVDSAHLELNGQWLLIPCCLLISYCLLLAKSNWSSQLRILDNVACTFRPATQRRVQQGKVGCMVTVKSKSQITSRERVFSLPEFSLSFLDSEI